MKTSLIKCPGPKAAGWVHPPAFWMLAVSGMKPMLLSVLIAVVFLGAQGTSSAAGPAPVDLLSTAHFVILSGAAITTTGGGIINGDVGASPIAGSAIGVTCAQVNGTM